MFWVSLVSYILNFLKYIPGHSCFISIEHRGILASTFVYDYQTSPIHASLNDPTVFIQRCKFIDCKAGGAMEGGAILIQSEISQISIQNSLFNSCSSISGGACSIVGLSIFFSHCCFDNCNSSEKGNAYVSITVLPNFDNSATFLTVHKCCKGYDAVSLINGRQTIQHSNFSHNSAGIAAGASFRFSKSLDCFLCQFELSISSTLYYVIETDFPKFSFNNLLENNVQSMFVFFKVKSSVIDGCSFVKNQGNLSRLVNQSTAIIQNCVADRIFEKDPNIIEINNKVLSSGEIQTVLIDFNSQYCNEANVGSVLRLFISVRHVSFIGFVIFTVLGSLFLCQYKKQIRRQEELLNLRRRNRHRIESAIVNEGATFNTDSLNIEPAAEEEEHHPETNEDGGEGLQDNVDNRTDATIFT